MMDSEFTTDREFMIDRIESLKYRIDKLGHQQILETAKTQEKINQMYDELDALQGHIQETKRGVK